MNEVNDEGSGSSRSEESGMHLFIWSKTPAGEIHWQIALREHFLPPFRFAPRSQDDNFYLMAFCSMLAGCQLEFSLQMVHVECKMQNGQ
jgi:hypothetical protein